MTAVQSKLTGTVYAMKKLSKARILKSNSVSHSHVLTEMWVMSKLRSPFTCTLYYAFQDRKDLFLVMDICLGGDLKYHIRNLKSHIPRNPVLLKRYEKRVVGGENNCNTRFSGFGVTEET